MKKKLEKELVNKERKEDVKKLLKSKQYDKIFERYGRTIYKISVPGRYKNKDIKNLLKQQRFEDIYRKYGYTIYNRYINKMEAYDVFYETGSKPKSILKRIKNAFLRKMVPYTLSAGILLPAGLTADIETQKLINSVKYEKEIENYNDKIEKYAKEINSMKLTDIQIFMKIIDDMWKEIDGYAFPKNEIEGYLRLTLDNEKIGVCRNFADDITAKLNAINPEYHARNLCPQVSLN